MPGIWRSVTTTDTGSRAMRSKLARPGRRRRRSCSSPSAAADDRRGELGDRRARSSTIRTVEHRADEEETGRARASSLITAAAIGRVDQVHGWNSWTPLQGDRIVAPGWGLGRGEIAQGVVEVIEGRDEGVEIGRGIPARAGASGLFEAEDRGDDPRCGEMARRPLEHMGGAAHASASGSSSCAMAARIWPSRRGQSPKNRPMTSRKSSSSPPVHSIAAERSKLGRGSMLNGDGEPGAAGVIAGGGGQVVDRVIQRLGPDRLGHT